MSHEILCEESWPNDFFSYSALPFFLPPCRTLSCVQGWILKSAVPPFFILLGMKLKYQLTDRLTGWRKRLWKRVIQIPLVWLNPYFLQSLNPSNLFSKVLSPTKGNSTRIHRELIFPFSLSLSLSAEPAARDLGWKAGSTSAASATSPPFHLSTSSMSMSSLKSILCFVLASLVQHLPRLLNLHQL